MDIKELMDRGKRYFNYHPDENFTSIEHMLYLSRRNLGISRGYELAASLFAEDMARFIDERMEEFNESN